MKNTIGWFLMAIPASLIAVSCNSSFYSKEDFWKVKKIDAHIHYESEDDAFSVQAKADNFYLIDVNHDRRGKGDDSALVKMENTSLIQKKHFPSQFNYLTAFTLRDWNSPVWAEKTIRKLEASFNKGAIGVKLYKMIGMSYKDSAGNFIMIDNPRFDPVIEYIIKQDKAILGHFGEPKNCWLPFSQMTVGGDSSYYAENPEEHMFMHPEKPSYQVLMDARDRFVRRHPDMRFIGAHLGSLEWSVDELAKELDEFPNMAVDLAARLIHLQYQSITNYVKVRDFMINYQDRLIYGTDEEFFQQDNPQDLKKNIHKTWLDQWTYLVTDETMKNNEIKGKFKGLKLPKAVIDKIYRTNALKWYKPDYKD